MGLSRNRFKFDLLRTALVVSTGFVLAACASKYLKYEKSEQLKEIGEFDQKVKIENVEEKPIATTASQPPDALSPSAPPPSKVEEVPSQKKALVPVKKIGKKKAEVGAVDPKRHEPELEGQIGFVGRRPIKDPFRVGERVLHSVNYFNVKAGELEMAVKPFATVNGRKSYNFRLGIKTAAMFSSFYSVDDSVTSLVDFESFVPSVFTLHVKESGQLREARFFFDWEKKVASYWEKKVTEKDGPEEKKLSWEVPEYSQHIFSSAFYLRNFEWSVGSQNAFRVADDNENLIFRAKAVRKEEIQTQAGKFSTVVLRPEIELKGQFKPVGDIFIWLSDDDRKFLLKIESKIKIGTLVSEVIELDKGQSDEGPSASK